MSTWTHYDTYLCSECEHEWSEAVTEDGGGGYSPPESDAPSSCPKCESDNFRRTDLSYDDPNAPDCDEFDGYED